MRWIVDRENIKVTQLKMEECIDLKNHPERNTF